MTRYKIDSAPILEQHQWFNFIMKCAGYTFFSKLDGKKVAKYILFERHKHNPNLIAIASGDDTSIYTRVNSEGWFNGECQFEYEIDQINGTIMKSRQGRLFESPIVSDND